MVLDWLGAVEYLLLFVEGQLQTFAPFLVVLRLSYAWDRETRTDYSDECVLSLGSLRLQ